MAKKATAKRPAKKPAAKKAAPKKKAATTKRAAPRKPPRTPAPARPGARGRPSGYTAELATAICGWIKQGYTLRQIGELPNMPDKSTIMRWLAQHEKFCDQYVRAGEIRALVMADDIQEIADNSLNDWVEVERKGGRVETVPNEEAISRARLRIDSRKWLMEKMAPKRYGRQLAVTGPGGGPLKHEHATTESLLAEIDGAGTGLPANADHSEAE